MMGEEAPGVLVVLVGHQDSHAGRLARLVEHIFLPYHGQEQRARRIHDGDVRQQPAAVVGLQQLDDSEEERMLRH